MVRLVELVDPTVAELMTVAPQVDPEAAVWLCGEAGDGRGTRPRLETHGTAVVGIVLIPTHDDAGNAFTYREVGVVVAPAQFVLIRKTDHTGSLADVDLVGDSSTMSAGTLLQGLVDDVAESYLDLVDSLNVEIDELEDHVDELAGDRARQQLAGLRHEMLHARKNVSAIRAMVRRVIDGRLDVGDNRLFPREVEQGFADTYDTLVRVTEELDIARDLLAGVRDYLQSKVAENQNDVVKKLTVIASLVLVPTLITGFFGQNFAGEFSESYWGVGMSLALIVVATVLQLAVFRWKRWI